jgi:hypothetical protein
MQDQSQYPTETTQAEPQVATEPTTKSSTVETFVHNLAEKLGEDPDSIKVQRHLRQTLEAMENGAIVSLRISRPRFTQKVDLEMLGFRGDHSQALSAGAEETLTKYFTLGRRSLLHKDYQDRFQACENSARYNLKKFAIKTHWGSFVPENVYADWKREHLRLAEEYWQIVEDLRQNYPSICAELLAEYRKLAEALWQRLMLGNALQQQSNLPLNQELWQALAAQLHAKDGKEAFIERYLATVNEALPTPEALQNDDAWAFETEVTAIPLPSTLAKDMIQADRTLADHAIKDAKAQAELEKIENQRQLDRVRAQREQLRLDEERMRLERKLSREQAEEQQIQNLRLQHERETLRRRRLAEEDILKSARADKQRLVNDFYRDVVGRMNELIKETMEQVLTSLDKNNGNLRGPVSAGLMQLVERLEKLNFVADETIEVQIDRIRAVLPTKAAQEAAAKGLEKIDTRPIERVARQIQKETQEILIELGTTTAQRTKRRGPALDEPADLIELGTRKARPGDGLTTPKTTSTPRRPRATK